jgi:hypothetical protein
MDVDPDAAGWEPAGPAALMPMAFEAKQMLHDMQVSSRRILLVWVHHAYQHNDTQTPGCNLSTITAQSPCMRHLASIAESIVYEVPAGLTPYQPVHGLDGIAMHTGTSRMKRPLGTTRPFVSPVQPIARL